MDEVVPPMVDDPNQYLVQGGETGWRLMGSAAADSIDDDGEDDEFYSTELHPGDIIEFWARRMYGDVLIEVADDGTFTVLGDYPDDTTHFAHEDSDIYEGMCDDMATVVREGNPEAHGTPLAAGSHRIDIWHWSDGHLYQFEIENGAGVLKPCGRRQ